MSPAQAAHSADEWRGGRGGLSRLRSHRELQLVSKPSSASASRANALQEEEGRVPSHFTKHRPRMQANPKLTGTHHIFSSRAFLQKETSNLIELFLLSLFQSLVIYAHSKLQVLGWVHLGHP